MNKLVVVIMGQNANKFLRMCLDSVKDADRIVYCDGGSTDETWDTLDHWEDEDDRIDIIRNEYSQSDPAMNGKQRNFYLNYVRRTYPDDWCLAIDADEVVDNLNKIKDFIQTAKKGLYSVKMRHFHGDLGHEDATQKEHFVLNRLFKISEVGEYPEVEHPVLQPKQTKEDPWADSNQGITDCTTIWHLAHIQHCFEIKKRYDKNVLHSNMHPKEYLDNWYRMHLFGTYPTRQINLVDIPETILNNFGIDKDEIYFANRNLEFKHFMMMKEWIDYFYVNRPSAKDGGYNPIIIEFGSGKAPFGYVAKYLDCDYHGVELSKFAVTHSYVPNEQGDIATYQTEKQYDICLLIDILEHLKYEDLDKALKNIRNLSDLYIVSLPFKGTPDCESDKTHIIKESKEWWQIKFEENGFRQLETPNISFKDQILIFQCL